MLVACTAGCKTELQLACSTDLLFPSGSASAVSGNVWQGQAMFISVPGHYVSSGTTPGSLGSCAASTAPVTPVHPCARALYPFMTGTL